MCGSPRVDGDDDGEDVMTWTMSSIMPKEIARPDSNGRVKMLVSLHLLDMNLSNRSLFLQMGSQSLVIFLVPQLIAIFPVRIVDPKGLEFLRAWKC
ncbi:hypothetical protein HAX54_012483 [Datura stramonium]|uniref:Uncharacterized protein n=1 Tax=Datura stramonium TaxID=4076 RepID=A0ABS8TLR3_DATST|nr:hypothetical protein [Datura stramonium]